MIPDEKLKEIVQKLEPILGPKTRQLWYRYLLARTPERKELWRRKIRIAGERYLGSYQDEPTLPPPTKDITHGSYELGFAIYPARRIHSTFGLREEEFCKHIMISGMTGVGKTNAALQIIWELKKHQKARYYFCISFYKHKRPGRNYNQEHCNNYYFLYRRN